MGWGDLGRRRRAARRTRHSRAIPRWFAALPFALFSAPCFAQDTISSDAQVAILEPGSIAKVADMDFGQIAQPGNAGTVVLTPTPTAACATTGGLVRTGACRAAEFIVREARNGRVRIREENGGTITLTGPGGATMQVTNLTIDVSDMTPVAGGGNSLGRFRIASNSGIASFRVGGTLQVAALQPPGAYVGTLDMRVQFN